MDAEEARRKITAGALQEFLSRGYTGASMDRISSSVGMSKRTVYQVFPSKEALFREVMDTFIAGNVGLIDALVADEGLGFEEKLRRLMEAVGSQLTGICQPLMNDLRTRFPDIWHKVHDMRGRLIDEYWGKLMREGRRQGAFRAGVDHRLVALMLTSTIQGIMTPEVLAVQPFSAAEAFDGIMSVLMHGILEEKEVRSKAAGGGRAAVKERRR